MTAALVTRLEDVDRVVAYARSRLSVGSRLLRALSSALPVGAFYAIGAKAGAEQGGPYDFEQGWSVRLDVDSTEVAIDELVTLGGGDECFLLAHAYQARPDDPWIRKRRLTVNVDGDDVYFTSSIGEGRDALRTAIRSASAIWYSAAVLTTSRPPSGSTSTPWTMQEIAFLRRGVRAVLLGAYDDQGYILWTM